MEKIRSFPDVVKFKFRFINPIAVILSYIDFSIIYFEPVQLNDRYLKIQKSQSTALEFFAENFLSEDNNLSSVAIAKISINVHDVL